MSTKPQLSPIDEMLGIMLEKWCQRYNFECDREKRRARFTRGVIEVTAEEVGGDQIRVSFVHEGSLFTKTSAPSESARAIEGVILTEEEVAGVAEKACAVRPWLKFWK